MWFPIPDTPDEIEIVGYSKTLSISEIFKIINDPGAVEWKEKVGVATPADGSAKSSTRLLKSGQWVFKTDINLQDVEKNSALNYIKPLVQTASRVKLWHPDKFWIVVRVQMNWLPISVCPLLTTIRQFTEWNAMTAYWTKMIIMGLDMSLNYGIGIDLNPSNFGLDKQSQDLYYLDDEYYGRHSFRDMAEAVVSRIPETPSAGTENWRQWGRMLQNALKTYFKSHDDRREFIDGIRDYPLTYSMEEKRRCLLEVMN